MWSHGAPILKCMSWCSQGDRVQWTRLCFKSSDDDARLPRTTSAFDRKQQETTNVFKHQWKHPPYNALTPLCTVKKPSRVRGVRGEWRYGSRHSLPRHYMPANSHPRPAPPRPAPEPSSPSPVPGGSYCHSTRFGKRDKTAAPVETRIPRRRLG